MFKQLTIVGFRQAESSTDLKIMPESGDVRPRPHDFCGIVIDFRQTSRNTRILGHLAGILDESGHYGWEPPRTAGSSPGWLASDRFVSDFSDLRQNLAQNARFRPLLTKSVCAKYIYNFTLIFFMLWIKFNFLKLIWFNKNIKNICNFSYALNTEK